MEDLFENIVQLHEKKLYSNIIPLLGIVLHQEERRPTGTLFSPLQEHLLNYYYAESLYHAKDFKYAEEKYSKSLELRKANVTSSRRKTSTSSPLDFVTEADLKFQVHLCRLGRNDISQAILILEDIPIKQRNAKVHTALGKLYRKERVIVKSVAAYKEVIRDNPLALDAMVRLVQLGVSPSEVCNISHPVFDWLLSWLQAQAALHSCKPKIAVDELRKLLTRYDLQDNCSMMADLGRALYYDGDIKKALTVFKGLFKKYPDSIEGLDCFAACLYMANEPKVLEEMCTKLISRCETGEDAPEPWIALGYLSFMNNKKDAKSLHFTQKACIAGDNSTEAILLKSRILAETKSAADAISCLIETSQVDSHRFEVVKTLADLNLAENKRAIAMTIAKEAVKTFGATPRTLTLLASVLLSEPDKGQNKKEAKKNLEKALAKDRGFLPAAFMLSKIYQEEKTIEKAIEVLLKCLELESTQKLHKLLADCYNQINDHEKAMYHQNIAAKLEVSVRPPTEASQSLNAQSNTRGDAVLEIDADDAVDSENEAMEESETDIMWSDPDF